MGGGKVVVVAVSLGGSEVVVVVIAAIWVSGTVVAGAVSVSSAGGTGLDGVRDVTMAADCSGWVGASATMATGATSGAGAAAAGDVVTFIT